MPSIPTTPNSGRPSPKPRTRVGWFRDAARLVLGAAAFVAAAYLIREHYDDLERWLTGLGGWAPVAFVGVHAVLVPLFFPVSILGFMAGATFGFWVATATLLVSDLVSASIMYWLGRGLLAGRVRAYAASRPRLRRFLHLADADAPRLMVLLRLSPLHYGLVCYLLGAGRVRFRPYFLTSAFVLPSAVLQAYVGATARIVGRRIGGGNGLETWQLVLAVVGVVAAALLATLLGRLARRALEDGSSTTPVDGGSA